MKKISTAALAFCLLLIPAMWSHAVIVVDYTQDDGGFFSSNAVAKASLDAAVSDINAVLDLNLGAITNDMTTGTAGTTSATFNFSSDYTHPTTGATVTLTDTEIAVNEIRIFAGARLLIGSTLAQGGPGVTYVSTVSLTPGTGTTQAAFDNASLNDQHRRGDGPVINKSAGSAFGANYSFDMGLALGNIWFDNDTNWHFDHSTPVTDMMKFDFYSVALHETLHAIGLGTSLTWADKVSGGDWTGTNAITENGTGIGLIDGGGQHLATGIMSTPLLGGPLQEVVMSPSIMGGARKYLTDLDVAFLQDLNYSITAVPEPSAFLFLALIASGTIVTQRLKAKKLVAASAA